jgi:hypothetical protein
MWREGLFRKMEQEGVPVKLVRLVRVWYQGVSVEVKMNDVPSLSFETKVGVRQGDGRDLGGLTYSCIANGGWGRRTRENCSKS